jgi:hypothetical protein
MAATKPSATWTPTPNLHELAVQAETLSKELNYLRFNCGHESTSTELFEVAKELVYLSSELESLNTAVHSNKSLYTDAFDQDLSEIRGHLSGIFEDIGDCCREMQKADALNASTVGWLTKKRYVRKLQKHLEANKTTLIVMRTVLFHGKEYGKHQ